MEFANYIIFVSAFLLIFSVFAGLASSRIGAPLLLTFLAVGMLFGENGPGGIVFNDMHTAYLIGSSSLAVILFGGGLHTPSSMFRMALWPALSLSTLGVVITAAVTGAVAAHVLKVTMLEGLLFGAVLASTDAAAVFLLLRQRKLQLSERLRSVLEVESGMNDPMAIFLTIGLVEMLLMPQQHEWVWFLAMFAWQMGSGIVAGVAGGRMLVWVFNNTKLASGLLPIVALSGGLLIFSGTLILEGSGFLAVYLAGLVMGNATFAHKDITVRFCDGLAWLCQIVMFLMIGLLVTPTQLAPQLVPALLIALALIFIARPLATFISLPTGDFTWREKSFLSWVGLRGAVPIFLAIIPALAGVDHSRAYFNIAFVVVVLSLTLQGWTIFKVAEWLKLEVIRPPETPKE